MFVFGTLAVSCASLSIRCDIVLEMNEEKGHGRLRETERDLKEKISRLKGRSIR